VKLGIVAAGYLASFVIAAAVVAVRVALTSGPDAQASSGMHAFGDAFLFLNVFGMCALVPTGLALYFLRPYCAFWGALGRLGIVVALTGVAAVAVYAFGRTGSPAFLTPWATFSPLRMLVAPLFAAGFLVCALVSPRGFPRVALLSAAVMEIAVSAYIAIVWFVPLVLRWP
jgi:hypothetical protein